MKDKFFAYDPGGSFETFDTEAEAEEFAIKSAEYCWPSEVERIYYGKIISSAKKISKPDEPLEAVVPPEIPGKCREYEVALLEALEWLEMSEDRDEAVIGIIKKALGG